ncbi:MAG: serine hydrolase domain-containing protein [Steroidobacteraceae bacterium]|jgi:CubicO group peptidase (beta-lactamase class C family)
MVSINRRNLLALGLSAAVPGVLRSGAARAAVSIEAAWGTLERFIEGYRVAMNAPGLTLGVADAQGTLRVSSSGYADLAAKTKVSTSDLFEIGSITKSFVGLVILQLHDQGKVDLRAPIHSYLPWLSMETPFGEILVHHLLTHSSGMPEDAPIFPAQPCRRPRQAFAPGSEFHYSNWGYGVLGQLIATLDGKPWPAAVSARILRPLGMTHTAAAITSAVRARVVQSYTPLHDDRPYPRHGALAPAGNLTVEDAAGSIASTPADMALYMRMILNGGAYPGGRIVSEESFSLFHARHIAAPDFGPQAAYGYGIAVDDLDGHRRLRHTGGMVSFMSAIHMDLDAGIGAFASINAQLGYRPNPVAELALRLVRAAREGKKLPPLPAFDESEAVEAPQSYAGVYTAADGRRVEVGADAARVHLIVGEQRIPLQHSGQDTFIAEHPQFDLYPLVFERGAGAAGDSNSASKRPIIALAYGADWYVHPAAQDARALDPSAELARYEGTYCSDSPWYGQLRVVQRQRQLWIGGTDPLVAIGDHLFRVGAKPSSPEIAEFLDLKDGVPELLWFDGGEFRRCEIVAAAF